MLKLFRRHESKCTQGYGKDDRIYEADSAKRSGRAQCQCPISGEGRLASGYLRPKSTGCRDWEGAKRVTAFWEKQGEATPAPAASDDYRLVSIADAVKDFYAVKGSATASDDRIRQYKHLLDNRLLPYAEKRRVQYIQEMDNAKAWSDFRLSWTNENPGRNRKIEAAQSRPLTKSTAVRLISDMRVFLKHCVSREWLSDNWGSREHGMIASAKPEPKEPFNDQDLLYTYRAWEHITDGKGFCEKRTGTQNGLEALVFAWVLRYTGLRISDVVSLDRTQLIPFESGIWTHAIWCHPGKTQDTKAGNYVHIPIPGGQDKLDGHPDLVGALQSLPLKHGRFFFLGGGPVPERDTPAWRARIKHATNGWRERLTHLFQQAELLLKEDGKSFSVHPHPHRFRHTFAAWLLQHGVTLRTVASYLGDTEDTVRDHYAKFCVAEQVTAAREMGEALLRGPQPAQPGLLRAPVLLVANQKSLRAARAY